MRSPSIAIVIPNYNSGSILYKGKSILLSCIKSLKRTAYGNMRIIIADNSSTDNSKDIVGRFKNVEFLEKTSREEFAGIARTNNFGIKYALKNYNPDYILMYNTDMLITEPGWLSKLVSVAESDESVGIVSCKLLYPTKRIQHTGMIVGALPRNIGNGEVDRGQYDTVREVDGVTAALALIRKDVFGKVGYFDRNFYNGFDDADFCLRARERGFRIVCYGKTSIIHFEGFASANSPDKTMRDRSFFGFQESYAYYALKDLRGIDRLKAISAQLLRSFVSIEGNGKARGLDNLTFKDRKLWRLGVSIRAIREARKLYARR